MSELLPCPFCGGEAEIREKKVHHSDWFGKDYRLMYRARCKKCGANVGKWEPALLHRDERTSREWGAIAAWNTRYHSAFEETVIKAWEEIKAYQERTCKVAASYDTADVDSRNSNAEWYFAFTCGCELYWDEPEPPNYCPNCGAKVVNK